MRRLMLITLMAFPLYGNAADFESGNTLKSSCNAAEDEYFSTGRCGGYITGIVDSLNTIEPTDAISGFRFCIPEGVTIGQLVDVWEKWSSEHPELMHVDAASLVASAMADAFPCK